MLQNIPTPTLLAVATGIAGAAWSSGSIASLSIISCPAALGLQPESQAVAWAGLYNHGMSIMRPIAVAVALASSYAGYVPRSRGVLRRDRAGYLVAAALAVAIVPYTIVFMRPTNDKLMAAALSQSGMGSFAREEIRGLIERWAALNLGRSLLPLMSGVVGMVTFVRTLD